MRKWVRRRLRARRLLHRTTSAEAYGERVIAVDGLETRRWNGTKSACADCADTPARPTRFVATSVRMNGDG